MARELDHALDAGLMDLSFDVMIYIYVGIVLEKWQKNLGSKNMSEEENRNGHVGKRLDNNHKQRDA